jgi:hypothetical protein
MDLRVSNPQLMGWETIVFVVARDHGSCAVQIQI